MSAARHRSITEIREQAILAEVMRNRCLQQDAGEGAAYWTGIADALSWLLRERDKPVTQEMLMPSDEVRW